MSLFIDADLDYDAPLKTECESRLRVGGKVMTRVYVPHVYDGSDA